MLRSKSKKRTFKAFIIMALLNSCLSGISHGASTDSDSLWNRMGKEPADLKGHWSEKVFHWAVVSHIIEGYPDGTFRPDQQVTEAEFLKILYRSFGAALPVIEGEDWTNGPYRLASMWNHPAVGADLKEARQQPISRIKAAEIISSARGVNYEGANAVRYLMISNLVKGKTTSDVEGFAGNDLLTRAETVQWIRTLKLKGMWNIEKRSNEPSDPSMLGSISATSSQDFPDFMLMPGGEEDFNLTDEKTGVSFARATSKDSFNKQYGTPEAEPFSIRGFARYGDLSIHYDANGQMDAWTISVDETNDKKIPFRTYRGIKINESSLFDVLQAYGTAGYGYDDDRIANYFYEKKDGHILPRYSRFNVEDPDQAFVISFVFDEKTLKVRHIYISTYAYAFRS